MPRPAAGLPSDTNTGLAAANCPIDFTPMSPLLALASHLSERIRVNTVARETCDGRRFWVKRRRRSAPLTLACANLFFRLAGCPVHALAELAAWQRWEVESFLLLHGENFRAFAVAERGVAAEEMPGVSLAGHLDGGTMTPAHATAAGAELRRCHSIHASPGGWSHGDPHAGNFLYDAAENRARLIDFELVHHAGLPVHDRQADDVLVFLQDVVGRVSTADWLALARAFLDAYDRSEVIARLAPRLILPRGFARLWWAVRTTHLPDAELARRFELLRDGLGARAVTADTAGRGCCEPPAIR